MVYLLSQLLLNNQYTVHCTFITINVGSIFTDPPHHDVLFHRADANVWGEIMRESALQPADRVSVMERNHFRTSTSLTESISARCK